MKTIFSTYNNKPLQCENTLSNSSSLRFLQWVHGVSSWVARMTKSLRSMIVRALKDQLVGLRALVMTSTANGRIFLGLGLMGVVAPLAGCAYMIFNRTEYVAGWYHVNYFHLFYLLGPHLFELVCLMGVFFLFPQGSKRAYLIAIPYGYVLAKVCWLCQVNSNPELWQLVPASFILGGMAISVVMLKIMNWLTWRQFHVVDSFDKRLDGIYQIAGDIPAEKVKSMFLETWRLKREFNSKY